MRVERKDLKPKLTVMCAGYELNVWRSQQLAKHLMRWLPEFALRHSERENVDAANAVDEVAKAARIVYQSSKYQRRGEFGEVLLHAILRQSRKSIPAISKYFYKDTANDTVKGFDAVHVVQRGDFLDLYLGEVKFYKSAGKAITAVMKEIEDHLQRDYLRSEFIAITNKLDPAWRHTQELQDLLNQTTSLDKIFSRVCIPVLLTYDSEAVKGNTSVCKKYTDEITAEVLRHHETFRLLYEKLTAAQKVPSVIRIELFLMPLEDKAELVKLLHTRLRQAQDL